MHYSLLIFMVVPALLASSSHGQCITENDSFPVGNFNVSSSLISDFGIDLFKELFPYNNSQNFFFSPYSIWSSLTLAYFGSSGNTETELRKVLRHDDKMSAVTSWIAMNFMYEVRQKNNSNYTLRVANRAYFDSGVDLKPCILRLLKDNIKSLNLTTDPQGSAQTINNWVSNITKNRIPELVTPGDLVNTNMALVNAAFFKGTWLYQFKKSATKKQLFYMSKEDYTFVDMMTQKGNFRYGVSEEIGAHIIELPYKGETVSMYIFLPPFITGNFGFDAMINRINSTSLQNAMLSTWRTNLELTIPKFKLQFEIGNELIDSLRNMGINDVFDQAAADLSTFSANSSLGIGKAIHKSYFEINEEGSEAAAATTFISFRVARPASPKKFICNHPFLFLIYDDPSETILFMGAYKNPKA